MRISREEDNDGSVCDNQEMARSDSVEQLDALCSSLDSTSFAPVAIWLVGKANVRFKGRMVLKVADVIDGLTREGHC